MKREHSLGELGFIIGKISDAEHELKHALDILDFVELSNTDRQRALKIAQRVRKTLDEVEKALGQSKPRGGRGGDVQGER